MSQQSNGGAVVAVADSPPKPTPQVAPSPAQQNINQANAFRPKGTQAREVNPNTGNVEVVSGGQTSDQLQAEAQAQQTKDLGFTPGAEFPSQQEVNQKIQNLGIQYQSQTGNLVNGVITSGGQSNRDLYVQSLLSEVSQGYKGQGFATGEEYLANRLGQVGLSYNPQTKTITDPLEIGIIQQQTENAKRVGLPGGGFGEGGPSTPTSERLGSSLGQKATGYLTGGYSSEQIASLITAVKNNPEYGGEQNFLVSNIGTENSTGSTAALNLSQARNTDQKNPILPIKPLEVQKSDISSLSNESLVNVGGTKVPATLLFVPTQEAVGKANAVRASLISQKNLEIAQENQLIEQSNLNARANYAIDLLAIGKTNVKNNANRIGAGLEFTMPPGSEGNPIDFLGVKITNPLLGTPLELFGEYVQNQAVSTFALLKSIPARAQTVSKEIADVLVSGIKASSVPLQEQIYSPYTKESAEFVAASSYEMPSLIGGLVKAGMSASKGKIDTSGLVSSRGPAVTATALGLDIAQLVVPFGRLNPVKVNAFKAVTEEGEVTTIAREVSIGYGSLSKVAVSVGEKPHLGEILPHIAETKLSKIDVGESGLELTTQGPLGTKILTSPEGLKVLQQSEKMSERDVNAAILSKETAKLIALASKKVPNEVRQKASVVPEIPLSTLKPGGESTTVVEVIIPKLQPIKGTLAETLQLEQDLIQQKSVPRTSTSSVNGLVSSSSPTPTSEFNQLSIPQTPSELAAYNQVFGINTMKVGESVKALENPEIRNKTTGDIDVDYADTILGVPRAVKIAKFSVKEFNKVAEKGREFFKVPDIGERTGTNVLVRSSENPKGETVLNILTKHDVEPGYLDKYNLRPFDIKIKGLVKVPVKEGSNKKGKFVTIEQNAMNRLESSITLHGPQSEKSMVQPPEYTKGEIQRTESGYTVLPHEYRIKDLSKLVSQDLEQISRNLKAVGKTKESERLQEIKNEYIRLYPEVNFTIKNERMTIEESGVYPSRTSSVLRGISSKTNELPSRGILIIRPETVTTNRSSIPSKKESKSSILKEVESTSSIFKESSKTVSSLAKQSEIKAESISKGSPVKSTLKPKSIGRSFTTSEHTPESSLSPLRNESTSKGITESPSKGSPLSPSKASPLLPSESRGSILGLTEGFSKLSLTLKPPKDILIPGQATKPDERIILHTKKRFNYIGNSTESTLVGLYNRPETIYGKVRTAKLSHKDYLRTTKGFPKLVNTKTTGLISTKKTSIGRKESKKHGVPKF